MSLLCYVAAPYADAAFVRVVHDHLLAVAITPTSSWATTARGPEDFSRFSPPELRRVAAQNDADLRGSDVCLVIARDGAGGEMFAEARVALEWGKPIVWTGRRTLSAWRSGVVLAEDLDAAILLLVAMRDRHSEGYRGHLLAHLAQGAA